MDLQKLSERDNQLYLQYKEVQLDKFNVPIEFGTAGFRAKAQTLDFISFRSGIFMALVSQMNPEKAVGFMITASHNQIQDNGFKFIDFNGEVLRQDYEQLLVKFTQNYDLKQAIDELLLGLEGKKEASGTVFIGRDTRPSSLHLNDLFIEAATLCKANIKQFDEVTTPQLHFCVYAYNELKQEGSLQNYYEHFCGVFIELVGKQIGDNSSKQLQLDCANGVGGVAFKTVFEYQEILNQNNVTRINTTDAQFLNDTCGAEFVQKEQKFPRNYQFDYNRSGSFDGDADRLVYYFNNQENQLQLLDGDRLLVLFMHFIKDKISKIQTLFTQLKQQEILVYNDPNLNFNEWSLGAVQTAYANGASTLYLSQNLNLQTRISPTGVKNIHHEAQQFDIGGYFEANGHGTVLCKEAKMKALQSLFESIQLLNPENELKALGKEVKELWLFLQLANQQVGDAISNLLMIESVLSVMNITVQDCLSFYTDLPNKTSKVLVKDKSKIKNTWDQTRCIEPIDIQNGIDATCSKYSKARSFIRPSGTEDVVRLYVEAENPADLLEMNTIITELVKNDKTIN